MVKIFEKITSTTIVFLILIENVAQIGSYAAANLAAFANNNIETHRLAKRMDLELCLGQFDVHKNTIIRTGESQAIGGKYLQGIELDTIEECQHLCCETDSCDVFIFESKKDGYCYLFECGTPENFHCKFTRHANYTSAVLTPVIRPPSEVTTPHPVLHLGQGITSNISQQEWELSNLKTKPEFKETTNGIGISGVGEVIGLNSGSKKTVTVMENSQVQKVNATTQCGRFQFGCHSGECIAVYNACDGIPQCEDGSDEGPECSGANNNNNLNGNTKTTQDIMTTSKIAAVPVLSQYPSVISQQTPQQQLQNMQQHLQSPAVMPPVVNNREDPNVWETRKIVSGSSSQLVDNVNRGNPESKNFNQLTVQQQLQQQQQQQADSFTNYVNNHGQNNAVYGVGSSTLEQSGLYMPHGSQDATNNNIYTTQKHQKQQHILLPPPPPPPPAPVNSNWQQQAIINQQKQQQQQQQFAVHSNIQQQQTLPEVSVPFRGQNEATQTQQRQPIVENTFVQQQKPQPAQNLVPSSIQQQHQQPPQPPLKTPTALLNGATNGEKKQEQDSDEYEDSEEKSTEPPKKHKHKKAKSKSKDSQNSNKVENDSSSNLNNISVVKSAITPVHEQYEIIHQNMALEFRDHDGQSERPGGAVLSLTLGLLITAALAILIGCRMRTVGKRTRRLGNKTPYSHEADFLVNGMYL